MVHVVFEFKDEFTHGNWRKQECTVSSVDEAKKIYGLGVDCDYRIISVQEC